MITVGQIGCGYWGPNLVRNISLNKKCKLKYVADTSPERRAYIENNYPNTKAIEHAGDILSDSEIDAVVIATPASTHFELSRQALQAGKHVFVEKPLTMNVKHAEELVNLAKSKGLTLMVGHSFLYNTAVEYLKKLVSSGDIGKIYYIYAQRLNLGVIRSDVNAMWNLSPHDLSIICYLLDEVPISVSANGKDYIQKGIEDVVFLNLLFQQNVQAHVHVSWLDPNKVRRLIVVGSKKMVAYDDIADDKITIYDKGFEHGNQANTRPFDSLTSQKILQRAGDILIPKIDNKEPLKMEIDHFLECISSKKAPKSDGLNGLLIVRILEAAQRSLQEGGRNISI